MGDAKKLKHLELILGVVNRLSANSGLWRDVAPVAPWEWRHKK